MGSEKYLNTIDKRLSSGDKLVVLDGATGTEIYRRGVPAEDYPWSLNGLIYNPQIVREIHYDYLKCGAHVVTANCFYTTRTALRRVQSENKKILDDLARPLTYLGVYLAKDAEERAHRDGILHETCVAGNVGPLEATNPYDPTSVPRRESAIMEHREKMRNLLQAGADFILIETMTTLYEGSAALEASEQIDPKPIVWVSFSCNERGTLWSGESMKEVADLVESYSPEALLINCTPIRGISFALAELSRQNLSIPLGAYANVEEPIYEGARAYHRIPELTPTDYGKRCREWWQLGARIIGGCCGTTPEDIREIVRIFKHEI